MKKRTKYSVGATFYCAPLKEEAMVIAPVESGTVAHIVPAKDPNLVIKYNIRTNKIIG